MIENVSWHQCSDTIAFVLFGFYWACKICLLKGSMIGTHDDFQNGS